MAQDPTTRGEGVSDCEVMASEDSGNLVIAAICMDDAWLSTPTEAAAVLTEWC
jgi:hypothetical protein